jgi:hypothetical protein
MMITMTPAVSSSVPSNPANAPMNATSSPPAPAEYTCSPAGRSDWAAPITAFSWSAKSFPETATPF